MFFIGQLGVNNALLSWMACFFYIPVMDGIFKIIFASIGFNLFNRNLGEEEMSFVDHLEALRWHIVSVGLCHRNVAIAIFIKINWIF